MIFRKLIRIKLGDIFKILILIFLFLHDISCVSTRINFSPNIIAEYNLSSSEIKNLQFYIGRTLELDRVVKEESSREVSKYHQLVTRYGKVYEIIFIEEGTPGIVEVVTDKSLEVSFEPGYSLQFIVSRSSKGTGIYLNSYSYKTGDSYYVKYGKYEYKMSGFTPLKISKKSLSDIKVKRRKVRGRYIKKTNPH